MIDLVSLERKAMRIVGLKSKRRAESVFERSVSRYGFAILLVFIAVGVKFLLDSIIELESPFLLLFAAILIAAWRGGFKAGLLATFLAAILADYYFFSPDKSFFNHTVGQNLRLLLFVCEGVLASLCCALKQRGDRALRRSHEELKRRIQQRTAELSRSEERHRELKGV